ncbi:MAG: amino acid permease [Nanoarchaeota archaeon]|nr:amino acid permease [Nanoarchaeota archaeon]
MAKLKRTLTLFNVTVAGVGMILGAGIYALIGAAAVDGGNAIWLSFLLSALIALFTGLSYAELSSMFKGDAGEYDYVNKSMHKHFALFIGLTVIAAAIITASAVALGFAGYLSTLLPIPYILGALLIIVLMSAINLIGIKEAAWFNTVSTFIEFAGLVIIIILGFKYIGSVNLLELPNGVEGIFSSAALVFFAFLGFESIIKLAEETKNPEKTIPKAILLSIGITSVVYVLVAISAVSVVGWEALSQSNAPLALVAATALGGISGPALAVIALFSTANTILLSLITSSRQIYGMSKEKGLPKFLSHVSGKTRTPIFAVLVATLVAIIFTLIGDIGIVANITNIFLFITFGAVNLALIILRYKEPKMKRAFKLPLNIGKFPVIPLIGILSSIIMIGFIIWGFIH